MSKNKFSVVGRLKVSVILGDIINQKVDVILNSSNTELGLQYGRLSSALLAAAGNGIQVECNQSYPNGIKKGEIAITSGGKLPCKAIYHGALSKYYTPNDDKTLETIFHSALDKAEKTGYKTIAVPAIGAGNLNYTHDKAANILISCIQKMPSKSLEEVFIVIYKKDQGIFQVSGENVPKRKRTLEKTYPDLWVYLDEVKKHSVSATHTSHPPDSLKIGNVYVKVLVSKLSEVEADVIVCSGPTDLQLNNKALAQSLLEVAGTRMQEELKQDYPDGIHYGDFAVSKGYKLKCNFVYHGALPEWSSTDSDPSMMMENLMDKCLERANKDSAQTIAFPTLGVGSLSYPTEESAKIMGMCIRDYCTCSNHISIKTIVIVVYKGCNNCADIQKEFLNGLVGGDSSATGSVTNLFTPTRNESEVIYKRKLENITVSLHIGNLEDQEVDVIVNSIGSGLGTWLGTASAISEAAGQGLSNELKQNFPSGIAEGAIAKTNGYNLRCKEVYNGYISHWYSRQSEGAKPPDLVLEDFVYACLEKANGSKHSSIAFPAIGTGFHKFPIDTAAESMVASIVKFSCPQHQQTINIKDVHIVLYGGSTDLPTLKKEFIRQIGEEDYRGKTPVIQTVRLGMTPVPPRNSKQYLPYKCGETIKAPPYWTKFTSEKSLKEWNKKVKKEHLHFEDIDHTTYISIQNAFKFTLKKAEIVKIQRVENANVFLLYGEERQRLFRKVHSEGQFKRLDQISGSDRSVKVMGLLHKSMTTHVESEINEFYLFHATKPDLVDIICKQGLDPRAAGKIGKLGQGVYCAEDSCKAHGYAELDPKRGFPMFLVRMSLGDIYMTQMKNSFRRPPCKVCTTKVCKEHQELHDSVVAYGSNFQHREFVVYDRYQSYPEYLIWYKV